MRSACKRVEIVAGADDDRLGFDRPAARLQPRRRGGAHRRLAQEYDAVPLGEPGGELRDRRRATPRATRAANRARRRIRRPQALAITADLARPQQPALRRPSRSPRNASSTASASGRRAIISKPALDDVDTGLRRDLGPHVARAHRAPPAIARLLAGDGDEAEIAHRGAVGCASRSITTTRLPRRAAASACASPQMPAPTMARS